MTKQHFAGLLIALASAAWASAAAQNTANRASDMGEFDCVIEPRMTIKLASPEAGVIRTVKVDRDKTISEGEVVAELDSGLQQIAVELAKLKATSTADLESQKARLEFRKSEAERAETLHSKSIASTKTLDEAVTERQLAELALKKSDLDYRMAQQELAEAQARLERRSVRSPVRGVVADITIRPGEYAYEQAPLMTIAEIDPLYVKVFLPVRYYRAVHVGSVGQVVPEDPIGGLHRAKVTVVDRVFDAASSTFGVRLELPNPDYALPAGLRCRVRFLAEAVP
jgi:RND family efflux transporter MFP subunit